MLLYPRKLDLQIHNGSRAEAKQLGANVYVGKPCARCDGQYRFVEGSACIERCHVDYRCKRSSEKHNSHKARQAAFDQGDMTYTGNTCRGCGGRLRFTTSASCVHCVRERSKVRIGVRAVWHTTERGKASARQHAMRRFIKIKEQTPDLTERERAEMMMYYQTAVHLSESTGEMHHVDHIVPISKGGLHHPNNLQVLTAEQNLAKRAKMPDEWYALKNDDSSN